KGTVKLHLDQKYVGVDITGTEGPNKGVTMLAISKATKDTMTVCYNNTGGKRPTEFTSTAENKQLIFEYKRK
ncbi:MAG: hypothetical protein GY940_30340, partial [bacterium]|nr:hypothetical protein [bacterium]MCP5051506.1 hypothetical protein [bacterium]